MVIAQGSLTVRYLVRLSLGRRVIEGSRRSGEADGEGKNMADGI